MSSALPCWPGTHLQTGQYFAGLAALHTLNERGDRLSGNWQEPGRDEQGRPQRFYIRGGMTYGVTALSQGNKIVLSPSQGGHCYCSVSAFCRTCMSAGLRETFH